MREGTEEDLEAHLSFLPEYYGQFLGIIQYMIYGHRKQISETVEYTITRDGGEVERDKPVVYSERSQKEYV